MDDIAKLDPLWTQLGRRGWEGRGMGVRFHIVGDPEGGFFVTLHYRPQDYGIHVRHCFPSLRAAQRFCERYFV